MEKRLSASEMDYVFKDREDCNIVTRNLYGEGNFTTETLYQAFKQRLAHEASINVWPEVKDE